MNHDHSRIIITTAGGVGGVAFGGLPEGGASVACDDAAALELFVACEVSAICMVAGDAGFTAAGDFGGPGVFTLSLSGVVHRE